MEAARVLEGLVRLASRVGSSTDANAALSEIVRGLVEDLGLAGAAVWQVRDGDLVETCAAGEPIEIEFARGAPCQEEHRHAWPLCPYDKTVGVMAIRGEIAANVRAVGAMLAGRCAHILADARGAARQRTLLAGLSHELRAPMQSLLGYADLLCDGTFGRLSEEQSEALANVTRNAERVLAITRDVLQVARIDAGRDEVIVGEVALHELLGQEVEGVRPLAEAAGLDLVLDCPATLVLPSDGAKIRRIVTNLLTNAVKYTKSGSVTVRAGSSAAGFFVAVEDTGAGIPAERQQDVFEEYVRLDGSREGTGLGLSIARRLAELLGGRLTLRSQPGAGTTVRLDLPACPAG